PIGGSVPVATQGAWTDYRLAAPSPLASLVPSWSVEPNTERAVQRIAGGSVSPEQMVLISNDPQFPPSPTASPGQSTTTPTIRVVRFDAQQVVITVESSTRGLLLVRQPYDPSWRATIDAASVPVLRADGFLQGLAMPPGRHTVVLRFVAP